MTLSIRIITTSNSLRQTVYTHCTSVHRAAKLVAALLRVARVTAGLAESNGSLPPGLWLTSPAGWLPRTGISSGAIRSAIEYWLPLLFYFWLFTLSQKKTICNPLAHPTWKCTTLTCKVPNFLKSDWRFALYLRFPYMRFPSLRNAPFRTCLFRTCVFQYLRFQRPQMKQSTILPLTTPNVGQLKKICHHQIER